MARCAFAGKDGVSQEAEELQAAVERWPARRLVLLCVLCALVCTCFVSGTQTRHSSHSKIPGCCLSGPRTTTSTLCPASQGAVDVSARRMRGLACTAATSRCRSWMHCFP